MTVASEPVAPVRALTTYEQLCAEFEQTFTDTRSGITIEYLTGEQVVSRLNKVLGVSGWSFRIIERWLDAEADACMSLGELIAQIDGASVVRHQYGGQKINRRRADGKPINISFDWKGSGTEALKKCAMLLGVGLYLSSKEDAALARAAEGGQQAARRPQPAHRQEPPSRQTRPVREVQRPSQPARRGSPNGPRPVRDEERVGPFPANTKSPHCQQCNAVLQEFRFSVPGENGAPDREIVWTPGQLAYRGQRRHKAILCGDHYRDACTRERQGAPTAASA